MGICPKTNSFASLFLINGEDFRLINPDGSYFDEEYPDKNTGKWYHYNTVQNPAIGYNEQTEQLVRSTRNANGQVVSQKINRRLNKFENLYWPYLSRQSVQWLRKQIAKFDCNLTYWDDESGQFITRQFYWGDFSATPCEWETVRIGYYPDGRPRYMKRPVWYKDVKCNLIDKGY